jgi:NAD-dependent SIR2 family protein deacetylase
MFGDGEYTGHSEQEKNFRSFTAGSIDLAILIGSSGAVPTNDYIAAEVMSRGGKVININPDPSTNSIVDTDYFIQMKSLEALVALDQRAFNR